MSRSRKRRKNRKPRRKPRYEVQLRAQIQVEGAASPDPKQFVDTLNQSPNLVGLAVGTRETRTRIKASLGFDSKNALLAWRNSSSLQELLQALRNNSATGNQLAMRIRQRKK
jgi:hypothetical protein